METLIEESYRYAGMLSTKAILLISNINNFIIVTKLNHYQIYNLTFQFHDLVIDAFISSK
jgi:hypothetical protein